MKEVRECTNCEAIMTEGYCIGGGEGYYCSDACLEANMSNEEYDALYDDGEGDTYWTQWYEPEMVTNDTDEPVILEILRLHDNVYLTAEDAEPFEDGKDYPSKWYIIVPSGETVVSGEVINSYIASDVRDVLVQELEDI